MRPSNICLLYISSILSNSLDTDLQNSVEFFCSPEFSEDTLEIFETLSGSPEFSGTSEKNNTIHSVKQPPISLHKLP